MTTTTRPALKIRRTSPGNYTTTCGGITYVIFSVGGCVAGFDGWVWHAVGEQADDIYPTKRDAVEALTHWIDAHRA